MSEGRGNPADRIGASEPRVSSKVASGSFPMMSSINNNELDLRGQQSSQAATELNEDVAFIINGTARTRQGNFRQSMAEELYREENKDAASILGGTSDINVQDVTRPVTPAPAESV